MSAERMLKGAEGTASPPQIPILIHRSDQLSTGQGVGSALPAGERAPPVTEIRRGMYCVPQKKIFAKVKAAI
jgi:hypothetical protein